jgi:hypothetical protein
LVVFLVMASLACGAHRYPTSPAGSISMLVRRAVMIVIDIRALLLDMRLASGVSRESAAAHRTATLIAYQPSTMPRLSDSGPCT